MSPLLPKDLNVADVSEGKDNAICHPGVYVLMQEAGQ